MRGRLAIARRGQVFAMDGLLAIIIILLLVSLIRSARTRLANERSEWASRFHLEKSTNDLIDALVRAGIEIKKINLDRVAKLKYPTKRNDVIQVNLNELVASRGRKVSSDECVAVLDDY